MFVCMCVCHVCHVCRVCVCVSRVYALWLVTLRNRVSGSPYYFLFQKARHNKTGTA